MVFSRSFLAIVLSPIVVATLITRVDAQGKKATTGCPADSVEVGPLCVDKHEASVWIITDPAVVQKVKAG
jgi:hypothetical protein